MIPPFTLFTTKSQRLSCISFLSSSIVDLVSYAFSLLFDDLVLGIGALCKSVIVFLILTAVVLVKLVRYDTAPRLIVGTFLDVTGSKVRLKGRLGEPDNDEVSSNVLLLSDDLEVETFHVTEAPYFFTEGEIFFNCKARLSVPVVMSAEKIALGYYKQDTQQD